MHLLRLYPTEYARVTNSDAPGEPGKYRAVFVLGTPGVNGALVSDRVDVREFEEGGDSLVMGAESFEMVLRRPDGEVTVIGHSNDDHRLSRFETTLDAKSLANAEEIAHDLVMPLISRLAFEVNVGIEVQALITTELATGGKSMAAVFVGNHGIPADSFKGRTNIWLAPLLSLYREGLTSSSPIYQALAFFKVTEGVAKAFHRMNRKAEQKGEKGPPDHLGMKFPAVGAEVSDIDSLDPDAYPEHSGQSLREVWESYEHTLRDAASHITPGKQIIVADYLGNLVGVRRAVPVLRYIARKVLEAEIADLERPSERTIFVGRVDVT
jgi:hypothetical protein